MQSRNIFLLTLALLLAGIILAGLALTPMPSRAAPHLATATAQASPTDTPTSSGQRTHTVRAGETIIAIAIRYGVTVDALVEANGLASSDLIGIGQELVIPEESDATPTPTSISPDQPTHRIRAGETIISIAIRYGVTVDAIVEANRLASSDLIGVGQELVIPDKPEATPTSTPAFPGQRTHRIRAGETIISIAIRYGVTADALVEANGLASSDFIRMGQELVIPEKSEAAPTPESQAALPVAEGDALFLCQANASVYPLDLPGDPIRLAISDRELYLIADGELYGVGLDEIQEIGEIGAAPVDNLTPDEGKIGQYTIRELVNFTVEPESGDLLLLDKSNDIYRYSGAETVSIEIPEKLFGSIEVEHPGEWRMEVAAAPVPGQFPDPQYLALQSVDEKIYVLDSDLVRVWIFEPQATTPDVYLSTGRLLTAVDMVFPTQENDAEEKVLMVLTRAGEVHKFIDGRPVLGFEDPVRLDDPPWPAQVFESGENIAVVDGEGRTLRGIDPETSEVVWAVTLRFPDMQRLRSVAVNDGMLYAVAGSNLYVADIGAAASGEECPPVPYDNEFYFDGVNIVDSMQGYRLPFPGAHLPPRPRSYPGARRLYRFGIHRGVDLYSLDVAGLNIGSTILSIADGTVTRADTDFVEMSPAEFEAVMDRTEAEHRTPPDLTEKLRGQQVQVAHGSGIQSWYAHLSGIESGIVEDTAIDQGDAVGYVGVSGTSSGAYGMSDGAHLHFEIWVNDRYLGQGLSLYETMRLWRAIFEQ